LKTYKDSELVYAATARCPCGAGLAYPPKGVPEEGPFKYWDHWDCSDILTGRAVKKGEPGAVTHTDKLHFSCWEVKSEDQPSAKGATTRPKDAH
jgi:hypothetical protein